MPPFYSFLLSKRSAKPLSPPDMNGLLHARNPAQNPNYVPGSGAVHATAINNNVVLTFFGILCACLVIASIWFFFWAKNGGFRWRKTDWSDYKSTVLRRKGPNGTTLSGATKTTELGGGSIVHDLESQGTYDQTETSEKVSEYSEKVRGGKGKGRKKEKEKKEKKEKKVKVKKNSHDDDVRAYRHEKPAKVGGLNREADGSYHDYSTTAPSEVSVPQPHPLSKHKPRRDFSYNPGTEATFSVYSDESQKPLRASPAHNRHSNTSTPSGTPTRSHQTSPLKRTSGLHAHASSSTPYRKQESRRGGAREVREASYTEPIDFESRYAASEAETEQTRNTKAYHHPIPGLSGAGKVGGNGFRRGGGGRRDSLSDSDGETGTVMS